MSKARVRESGRDSAEGAGAPGSRKSVGRSRRKPLKELEDRVGVKVGVAIRKGRKRPNEAVPGRGPDAKQKAAVRRRAKSPSANEPWVRRTYDLNEDLANDLRRNSTVVVGHRICRAFFGGGWRGGQWKP